VGRREREGWRAGVTIQQNLPALNGLEYAGFKGPVMGVLLGAAALASIGLMPAYEDDDDWRRREDWGRDYYWWFKVGGTAFPI